MTVLPSHPLTFERLNSLVLSLSALRVSAEVLGVFVSRPIIHDVPRELFRLIDAPQELLIPDPGRVIYSKDWRDVTLFCGEPEHDLPHFAVLEPVERGADLVEPTACCGPLTLWCPRCHKSGPRHPEAA